MTNEFVFIRLCSPSIHRYRLYTKTQKQVSREPKISSYFQIYPGANDTSILCPYKLPPLTKTPTKTNQKQGKTKRKIEKKRKPTQISRKPDYSPSFPLPKFKKRIAGIMSAHHPCWARSVKIGPKWTYRRAITANVKPTKTGAMRRTAEGTLRESLCRAWIKPWKNFRGSSKGPFIRKFVFGARVLTMLNGKFVRFHRSP